MGSSTSKESTSAYLEKLGLKPKSLNFSDLSIATDSSVSPVKSPRKRTNTFTLDSPLENLSEALSKALPHAEPLPKDKNGALQFRAHGQPKIGQPGAFNRNNGLRRSLPKPGGAGGLRPPGVKAAAAGALKGPGKLQVMQWSSSCTSGPALMAQL